MASTSGWRLVLPALAVFALAAMGWTAWQATPAGPASATGATPRDAFVGTATCASCHAAEHAAWQGSHHDLAMQEASDDAVLGDFSNATFTQGAATTTFSRQGDAYQVTTSGSDGETGTFAVAYTFGVAPLQQYLVAFPDGRLQPLPIAWDARSVEAGGQRWFNLYANETIAAGDPLHWTAPAQNWNHVCADCHSTALTKGYDPASDTFATTSADLDVGCESCHGPGARHVAWAEAVPLARALFQDGTGLDAASASAPVTCAQCHSRRGQVADGYVAGALFDDFYTLEPLVEGLYHPDGQPRDEVYVYGSFLQSRMYSSGVTCANCHEPHSQALRAPGNTLCATCHDAARYDAPSHTFHAAGSAGAACVSCHMPETTYMVVDPRRDHGFRVPRPDQTVSLGVPNACASCHADEGPQWAADAVRGWLGRDAQGFQGFAQTFAAAERGAPDAAPALAALAGDPAQPAIVRASALARLRAWPGAPAVAAATTGLDDPEPMVRRLALRVLAVAPLHARRAALPLLSDSARTVRLEAATTVAPLAGTLTGEDAMAWDTARAELVASHHYNGDRVDSRAALGDVLAESGAAADARAEYAAALALDATFVPAYMNLADLFRAGGDETQAELTLRDGLAAVPDDPDLNHALGLALVRLGRGSDALAYLARAAALAPGRAPLAYVYGVALNSEGQSAEAIDVLERALVRHPDDRDLLFALATFHRDAGALTAALRYAERMAATFPGDAQAQALAASLR
jgi:predicted CXXCH cytochrome family protein